RASRIWVRPIHALPQVRERAKRGTSRRKNTVAEWIVERVIWGQVVVLRCHQQRRAAEPVLPRRDKRRLREPAEASANHGVRAQLISHSKARLELVPARVVNAPLHSVHAIEELRTLHLERA